MKPSEKLRRLSIDDIPDDMSNREYWLKTEIYGLADEIEKSEAVAEAVIETQGSVPERIRKLAFDALEAQEVKHG